MKQIKFIDTTIRDGPQSLWAMNMRTRHMLPAMQYLDAAGFDQMEFFTPGSRMKKLVRHLGENPWDWIKGGVERAKRTPLRWHGHINPDTMSGTVPSEVGELLFKKAVDLGIRTTRMGDNWNNADVNRAAKERLDRLGMTAVINVIYSVSPKHTDEYFLQKAREMAALKPWRLCFKDVGGLLTPERTRDLLPAMIQAAGDVPWEFHGHCNNGLGPLNAIEAAKAGVDYIHTGVPPLANGTALPSAYNVSQNLRALGFDCRVDERALRPVTEHFNMVADRAGFPKGQPLEYDQRLYAHQIPGGMISNLEHQLKLAGVADRLEETLVETARVRAEFGYPIMVTPLSQFVGSQAAINVIVGERYRQVSDAVIEYALGRHGGDEAINGMNPEVRAQILDRPRAREIERMQPPDPSLKQLRRKYGWAISDEDLILRAIVGDDANDVLARTGQWNGTAIDEQPLGDLIRGLAVSRKHREVTVERDGLSVVIRTSGVSHDA